jgi:hypothetical protein
VRIALLAPPHGRAATELADALDGVTLIAGDGPPPLAALLRFRGIHDGFERVPGAFVALARGRFDVAHAFSPVDALAAVAWARRGRRAAVLTLTEPLRRATIADTRWRLATLERALGGAGAVVAANEEVRESARHLLALDLPVLAPADGAANRALYGRLLG